MTFKSTAPFVLAASVASVSGQGLYNLATLDDEYGSSPLSYVAGITAHYDDNVSPGNDSGDSSFALEPYVGASFANVGPRTSYSFNARVGIVTYLDSPEGIDDSYPAVSLNFNINHQISERLRFVGSAYGSYEREPDYSLGVTSAINDPYFSYGASAALGYRWTERLGTYTGVSVNGITYDDNSDFDRRSYGVNHSFRYQLTPQTVATLNGQYTTTDSSGSAGDSDNLYLTAGLEHRFNQNTIGVIRAGAQFRDVDGGESSTSPFVEASLRTQVNQQFALKGFLRYSIEDYGTSRGPVTYDENQVLRLGVSGTYQVSQRLSLHAGVNYITSDFGQGRNVVTGGSAPSFDQDIINFYTGFTLGLTDNVSLNGTYNHTDFQSEEVNGIDYDRNRFSLGVSATF